MLSGISRNQIIQTLLSITMPLVTSSDFKRLVAVSILKISKFVRENCLISKILQFTGTRSLLLGVRKRIIENIDDIYYETDIYQTHVRMIDGTDGNFYYRAALNGKISEPSVVRMIKSLLNELDSPTFVDIGAHIGYYAIYAGNLLGNRGSVVAIEPNERYFGALKKNIKLNGLEETTKAYNLALSDGIGKAEMGGDGDRYFIQSDTGDIEVISFDELCERENIRPDIVKIDVYGAEVKVLLGMTGALGSYVKHMFLETHRTDLMHGFDIDDVLGILKDQNLEVFEITDFREEHGGELVPVNSETFMDFKEHYDRMLYIRRA